VDKIWGAKPVGLQVYQILSDGELKDPKMIGNRSAAIIAIARRGGDRMMGDVYSWQIDAVSLFNRRAKRQLSPNLGTPFGSLLFQADLFL